MQKTRMKKTKTTQHLAVTSGSGTLMVTY